MTLNDFKSQNREFYGFFGDFGLRHKSVSFTRWRHVTIVRPMRSRERIWYLYINLAWTPQFSAKLLNWNSYRLSRVSWALAQISFKMWSRKRWVMCTGSTFQEWRCKSQHIRITETYVVDCVKTFTVTGSILFARFFSNAMGLLYNWSSGIFTYKQKCIFLHFARNFSENNAKLVTW